MAVVAGVVFFIIRALLALIPGLPDRRPIKKWAAFGALIATTFYLVLSGAEVATQRSYFMIAIVLVGVMLDRPALTIRTLTAAALLVLVLAPQSVVHPSFQICGDAGPGRGLRSRRAADEGRHRQLARAPRCGAPTRSRASSSRRWSRAWRRRLTRLFISTAWRPTASSRTCSPCRLSPPG
jgi:hypothetical protein